MKKSQLSQIIREEIQKTLFEIGEGTGKIYNWKPLKQSKNGSEYTFNSENTDYLVEIHPIEPWMKSTVVVSFSANSTDELDDKYQKVTNFNELYNVMATVMDIIIKHAKANEHIMFIIINPAETFEGDERRNKIYRRYIEKNINKLPNSITSNQWQSMTGENGELVLYR